jgi:hypothetical protein
VVPGRGGSPVVDPAAGAPRRADEKHTTQARRRHGLPCVPLMMGWCVEGPARLVDGHTTQVRRRHGLPCVPLIIEEIEEDR